MKEYSPDIFFEMPVPGVVLLPDAPRFTIVQANRAYLAATQTTHAFLKGKGLFEAFPNNPDNPKGDGEQNLRASFLKIIEHKQRHKMPTQRYDLQVPATGLYQVKYADPENIPILNQQNEVVYILHTAHDVTEKVLSEQKALFANHELAKDRLLLKEVEQISHFGTWEFDPATQKLHWSDGVFRICGYEPQAFEVTYERAMEVIHPDDRARALAVMQECVATGSDYQIYKRFVTRQKEIKYIVSRGRIIHDNESASPRLFGVFQDITEQVLNEQRFKSLVQEGSDLVVILDLEANYIYVSPVSSRMLQIEPEELLGKNAFDFIHPEDKDRVIRKYALLKTQKQVKLEPFRFRHKTREWRWLETILTNMEEDPSVKGVVANSRDVTEELELQKAVGLQHQQYTELFQRAPAFICILKGPDHTFQMVNEEFKRLKPGLDLIGKKAIDVFPEMVGQGYIELLDSVYRTGLSFQGSEIQMQLDPERNGQVVTVYTNFSFQAYRNINGNIEGIFVFGTDVTYQVIARLKIQENNDRYRYVTQATFDAIWDWDLATDTVIWGDGFRSIFGYELADMKPDVSSWTDHIYPADLERVITSITKTIEGNGTNWTDEYRYLKANGDYAYVVDRGVVVRDAEGKGVRMVGAMQDITLRKNEELKQALLAKMNEAFDIAASLPDALEKITDCMLDFAAFSLVETWLVSPDKQRIHLVARNQRTPELTQFYSDTDSVKSFTIGRGLPGLVWQKKSLHTWQQLNAVEEFVRIEAAKKAGIRSVIATPLTSKGEVVGVMVLGFAHHDEPMNLVIPLVTGFSEQLGAEIKRKQLEQELNQIFKVAPDILCIAGLDGYFKKFNPAMKELLEYSEEELLGTPFNDFVHPDDKYATSAELTKLNEGKTTFFFENRYITKSGKIKWLSWTAHPVAEEGLIYSVAKDVTDKKKLEVLLNKANELARIGSWEVDLVSSEAYWSAVTREIHEVDAHYVPNMGEGINFYKAGLHRSRIEQSVNECIKNGTPWDVELIIITAQGKEKWVRAIGEGEFVAGRCVRLYGSFQDIDSRKKAELAATEALRERNTILERITEAFFAVDKNWTVIYWNNKAEEVLMRPKHEVMNKNLWEVYADSVGSASYGHYQRAMRTNEAAHFEDYYEPLQRWYEISAYPSETGLSVYFKEITDRKRAENALRELNFQLQKRAKELASSNAELEQFAYAASHDLQEPLRMVTSFLTQLEKKYHPLLDDQGKQYIHFAVDGAKRMRQIILDLLEFSRAGKAVTQLEHTDLNDLLNEITTLHQQVINDKQAEIKIQKLPVVYSAKAPLRQVFTNLLNNALKYHRPGIAPRVEIGVIDTPEQWHFFVADNGIGINPEYFERIFTLFQRLHTRNEYTGTGIGLAICKKIVENLGGRITVESEEGKGSTFRFYLPKTDQGVS